MTEMENLIADWAMRERARIVVAWGGGLEDFASYQLQLGAWRQVHRLELQMADWKRKRGDDDDEELIRAGDVPKRTRTPVGVGADSW